MGKKIKRIISFITSAVFITSNAEIPLFVQATDFNGFDIKAMTAAFSEYKSLSDIGSDQYEQITDMYPLQMMSPVIPEDLSFDDQYNGEMISSPININDISELVELSKMHPASYQNANIVFAVNTINNDTADFYGLGSEKYPFKGTMEVSGNTPVSLVLNRALFNYVCDSAELKCRFILIRGAQDVESSLLADNVIHNDNSKGTWDVTINKGKDAQLQNV